MTIHHTLTSHDFQTELQKHANQHDVGFLMHFFRTGPGEYGQGDQFIGVRVPNTRKVCRQFKDMPLVEIKKLLRSPYHEHRLGAVILMVDQYKKADSKRRQQLYDCYMDALADDRINSWDIVDVSCMHIVGEHARVHDEKILFELAESEHLWSKRVGMVSCFAWLRKGELGPTLAIAEMLLGDSHDLIHKAVGWLLREVGKLDEVLLKDFLDRHHGVMARTTLRYAIERLPERTRQYYLKGATNGAKK